MLAVEEEDGGVHMEIIRRVSAACWQWRRRMLAVEEEDGGVYMEIIRRISAACWQWRRRTEVCIWR